MTLRRLTFALVLAAAPASAQVGNVSQTTGLTQPICRIGGSVKAQRLWGVGTPAGTCGRPIDGMEVSIIDADAAGDCATPGTTTMVRTTCIYDASLPGANKWTSPAPAGGGGGGGTTVRVDGVTVNNPNFVDTGELNFASSGSSVSGTVNADAIDLITQTNGAFVAGATTGQGLFASGTEGATLGLIQTCGDAQVLKYSTSGPAWGCANDNNSGGGASADGGSTEVQWNNGSDAFAGSLNMIWNNTQKRLIVSGLASDGLTSGITVANSLGGYTLDPVAGSGGSISITTLTDPASNINVRLDNASPTVASYVTFDAVASTLDRKTIDGGLGTASRLTTGNILGIRRHATDCTLATDGVTGEKCINVSDYKEYTCIPTSGGCDTGAEWKLLPATGVSNTAAGNIASTTVQNALNELDQEKLPSTANLAVDAANSVWGLSNGIAFEGATANGFETTFTVTDPTADRTITAPDASGTIALAEQLLTTGQVFQTAVAAADGDFLNLSAINGSSTTEGLRIPQSGSSCASATADGQMCWRTDTNVLYIGDGSSAGAITSSSPSDTAYASSWDTVTTTAPSKNAVYDWAHIFDTDDNGKVNVVDLGTAGIVETSSGGVLSVATPTGTTPDYLSPASDVPIITGNWAWAWTYGISDVNISRDMTLPNDLSFSGETLFGRAAAEALTRFQCVYLNNSSAWAIADANVSGKFPCRGLVTANVSSGAAVVITQGTVRNSGWSWTVGGTLYLSTTAGALTQTAPATSGDAVQVVGFATSATEIYVNFTGEWLVVQ